MQIRGRERLTGNAFPAPVFIAVAVLVGGLAAMVENRDASAAAGDPFPTNVPSVFVAQQAPTGLFKAVSAGDGSLSFEAEGSISNISYNAIAFREANGYIYGIKNGSEGNIPDGSIIRIGEKGAYTRVGTSTVPETPLNWGAFGADGMYYVGLGANTTYYRVNPNNGAVATRTLPASFAFADLTYASGYFWAIENGSGRLVRLDLATTTPSAELVGPAGLVPPGPYGAAWTFGNGNIGVSNNTTGEVTQIRLINPGSANPSAAVVSVVPGPASSNNDGASSPGQLTDLAVVKVGPATFHAGHDVTYTLTVTNNGPGNSSGWTITDELPAGLSNPVLPPSCSRSGATVTCNGGSLAAGASVSRTITAKSSATQTTCLTNSAAVLANEHDDDPSNNRSGVESCPLASRVTKTSDASADTRPGDVVTYTITVINVGAAPYTADTPAVVVDDLSGVLDDATFDATSLSATRDGAPSFDHPRITWTGPLAVGDEVAVTYSVTVGERGDRRMLNVAFAPPEPGLPTPKCDPADANGLDPATGLPCASVGTGVPSLRIEKAADRRDLPAAGEQVTYTVTATNVGGAAFTGTAPARVVDDLTAVLDDADFDTGSATADVGSNPVFADPRLTWSGVLTPGQSVAIRYRVTYTGAGDNVLRNVAFGPPPGDPESPTPGCDPRDAEGLDPAGGLPCATTQVPGSNLVTKKSVSPADASARPGEQRTYTLTFRNTGQADAAVNSEDVLTGILDDADITAEATPSPPGGLTVTRAGDRYRITGTIPPGGAVTVAYTVTVRPAAERGDSRLANFLVPGGGDPPIRCIPGNPGCVTTPVADLAIEKATATESFDAAEDEIAYRLVVTNTGGDTVNRVEVHDPKASPVSCPSSELTAGQSTICTGTYVTSQGDVDAGEVLNVASVTATGAADGTGLRASSNEVKVPAVVDPALSIVKETAKESVSQVGERIPYTFKVSNTGNVTVADIVVHDAKTAPVTCPAARLAPRASVSCAATYATTQNDLNAGRVVNVASVTGTAADGTGLDVPSDEVIVPAIQDPGLSIVKSTTKTFVSEPNEEIAYTFTITNVGNLPVSHVAVHDPMVGPVECPGTALAPGAEMTCTAAYATTQDDLDAGEVINLASVTGTSINGTELDVASNQVSVPALHEPELTVVKATTTVKFSTAGEAIPYTFTVVNTGNVSMSEVSVTDAKVPTINCPKNTLTPGQEMTCTGVYTVSQDDVDGGEITNVATVTGNPPGRGPIPKAPSNQITIPSDPNPELRVVKATTRVYVSAAGEEIPFTFTVVNTGNLTLAGVKVADPKVGRVTCPDTDLAPGEQMTCTGTYRVTQEDLDAGKVINVAQATGSVPGGDRIEAASNEVVEPVLYSPALIVVKAASASSFRRVGDVIPYTFRVTNVGNVRMENVEVKDPKVGSVDCPTRTLAPGESMRCTASYTVTAADVNARVVPNVASTTGNPPGGGAVPDVRSNEVTVPMASGRDPSSVGDPPSSLQSTVSQRGLLADTGRSGETLPIVGFALLGLGIVLQLGSHRRAQRG